MYDIMDCNGYSMPKHHSGRYRTYAEAKKLVDRLNQTGEFSPYKLVKKQPSGSIDDVKKVYLNLKNGNLYWVYRAAKMKVNGEWAECYFYHSADGHHYAREVKEFESKFREA